MPRTSAIRASSTWFPARVRFEPARAAEFSAAGKLHSQRNVKTIVSGESKEVKGISALCEETRVKQHLVWEKWISRRLRDNFPCDRRQIAWLNWRDRPDASEPPSLSGRLIVSPRKHFFSDDCRPEKSAGRGQDRRDFPADYAWQRDEGSLQDSARRRVGEVSDLMTVRGADSKTPTRTGYITVDRLRQYLLAGHGSDVPVGERIEQSSSRECSARAFENRNRPPRASRLIETSTTGNTSGRSLEESGFYLNCVNPESLPRWRAKQIKVIEVEIGLCACIKKKVISGSVGVGQSQIKTIPGNMYTAIPDKAAVFVSSLPANVIPPNFRTEQRVRLVDRARCAIKRIPMVSPRIRTLSNGI